MDFPGGPVAKTLYSQCRGPRFNPSSGRQILHASTKTWHSQINELINFKSTWYIVGLQQILAPLVLVVVATAIEVPHTLCLWLTFLVVPLASHLPHLHPREFQCPRKMFAPLLKSKQCVLRVKLFVVAKQLIRNKEIPYICVICNIYFSLSHFTLYNRLQVNSPQFNQLQFFLFYG